MLFRLNKAVIISRKREIERVHFEWVVIPWFGIVVSCNKSKRIMLQIERVVIWIIQNQRIYVISKEKDNSFPNCDTP